MSDEHGEDVPMSDCQGEHVSQLEKYIDRCHYTETLRDKFAMAALIGVVAECQGDGWPEQAADYAYRVADAMMEQRKK